MCGIAGFSWRDEDVVTQMAQAIAHRGPDQHGVYTDESVSLEHRRLSIIDLSDNGRQPLSNEDGSVWVIYDRVKLGWSPSRREQELRDGAGAFTTDRKR
jgi:asparagine synthase (glutamine-hydrolysing)